jgi:glycosyltransferase involved in cell wall biosynthesis
MNILILNWRDISHPLAGGAEFVTHEHAKGWVKKGHSVTWFTSWYQGAKKEETIDGILMVRKAGSLTVYPAAMAFVLQHGREFDVIVDEVHGFPFFSIFLTKTPVIVFIHEIAGIIWDFMYPFPINVIGKFVEKYYFYFYRKCFFWTDAQSTVEELIARGIPKNQCIAIDCPIIMHKEITVDRHINKEKDPTYLFVSRVVKMKGIEEVIKAFSFIARVQPLAKLWIIGSGDEVYIDTLKEMMKEYGVLDRVIFWGKVDEQKKYELMKRAHLLLHASVKEGWGLVVLEAASVGTPSVVYDVPGLRDVVKDNLTGVVIQGNSPHKMATEALRLLDDNKRYREFQKNGISWSKGMKWDDVILKSEKLLFEAERA